MRQSLNQFRNCFSQCLTTARGQRLTMTRPTQSHHFRGGLDSQSLE